MVFFCVLWTCLRWLHQQKHHVQASGAGSREARARPVHTEGTHLPRGSLEAHRQARHRGECRPATGEEGCSGLSTGNSWGGQWSGFGHARGNRRVASQAQRSFPSRKALLFQESMAFPTNAWILRGRIVCTALDIPQENQYTRRA